MPASAYAVFWTPLLDANVNQESRGRYEKVAKAFMASVREHGDRVEDAADLDYYEYLAQQGAVAAKRLWYVWQ